ncbi:MAG TPA: decaprenylphospho-beta-D-erythro-pentofuranosid-2-ulose 2-reductase [Gaiellales bacterium]|nr:decaprenylphospho-beta-D-erythro-pentofuranosid-2-ulose 2-reductase [Gaiellales bacterium]
MRDALGAVQSVLVLGGGSEIAQAAVRAMVARRTRTVILAGRRPQELEPFAEELRRQGAEHVDTVLFDGDDTGSHDAFADDVFGRHGDVDLALVAFGVLGDPDHDAEQRAAAVRVAHTNFTGVLSASLACAERMDAQGHGTIVVLSSVAGVRVRRSSVVYGATKAGIDGFAQGLGDRLRSRGVRVMVVRPGFVHTKMTIGREPAPFSTTPEVVAQAILDGLRRGSEVVWAPWQLRPVMLVARHVPRAIWRRLEM